MAAVEAPAAKPAEDDEAWLYGGNSDRFMRFIKTHVFYCMVKMSVVSDKYENTSTKFPKMTLAARLTYTNRIDETVTICSAGKLGNSQNYIPS